MNEMDDPISFPGVRCYPGRDNGIDFNIGLDRFGKLGAEIDRQCHFESPARLCGRIPMQGTRWERKRGRDMVRKIKELASHIDSDPDPLPNITPEICFRWPHRESVHREFVAAFGPNAPPGGIQMTSAAVRIAAAKGKSRKGKCSRTKT